MLPPPNAPLMIFGFMVVLQNRETLSGRPEALITNTYVARCEDTVVVVDKKKEKKKKRKKKKKKKRRKKKERENKKL